jgi:hypothetical protein
MHVSACLRSFVFYCSHTFTGMASVSQSAKSAVVVVAVSVFTICRGVGARSAPQHLIRRIASMGGKEAGAWIVGGWGYVCIENCGTAVGNACSQKSKYLFIRVFTRSRGVSSGGSRRLG